MSEKIKVLAGAVIDQIAAGEVVDRPAHMIKELCENALDAGATELTIDFSAGGRQVTIIDNGHGISPTDLPLALARHATSKISTTEDLWKISSFGFRGEALASIGAVSRLEITSRIAGAESGCQIQNNFGEVSAVVEVGADFGTRICVKELFANVPARLKFLKSEAGESSAIKTQLKALAMSHPQVSFRILHNAELLFYWSATASVKDRIQAVLEVDPLYGGEAEVDGYRARVYVSSPNLTVGQSRQIWLFVQNRYVQDRGLQAAVLEAYRQLLMHGEYPYAVINLECEPELVDVNVSPTKSQVKFQNNQSAFRAVQRAVRGVLERAPWLNDLLHVEKKTEQPSLPLHFYEARPAEHQQESLSFNFTSVPRNENNFEKTFERVTPTVQELKEAGTDWAGLDIIGQAALTYIVTQKKSGLIIVDQHAAHERVIFERLMRDYRNEKVEVQQFLLPLTVTINEEAVELILQHNNELQKMGLYIEQAGPQDLAIVAAPALANSESLKPVIEKIAEDFILKGGSFHFERVIGDLIATIACHSAVRAGQQQNLEQMQALLQQMNEFPLSSFCPHGRPVFVEYPFHQLERDFGRIV